MPDNSNNLCLTCQRLGSCRTAKKKNIYEEGCVRWLPLSETAVNANTKLVTILGEEHARRIMIKTPIEEKLKMTTEVKFPTPEEVNAMEYKEMRDYTVQNKKALGLEPYKIFTANTKEKLTVVLNEAIAQVTSGAAKPKRQAAKAKTETAAAKPKRQAAKPKPEGGKEVDVTPDVLAKLDNLETRIATNAEAAAETADNLRAEVAQMKEMLAGVLRCSLVATGMPGDSDEVLNMVKAIYPLG